MANKNRWMQDISGGGELSRQLGIPEEEDIPISLLRKIKNTDVGEEIDNPTQTGRQHMTVTSLLKKRAVPAYNMIQSNK